ncbi:hypothetical protein M0222_11600 [Myxococcus fulvus]|nr:hypothetical protein [Myxococcus fulvus]
MMEVKKPRRPRRSYTEEFKAGVPLATVQRILRHSDPAITTEEYGHLDVEDMRKGINQFDFAAPKPT